MKTLELQRVRISTDDLEEARIPQAHRRLGVDTYFGDNKALQITHSFVRNYAVSLHRGLGLIFTGAHGSLKTFLACYALRLLMVEGRSCFYLTQRELTDAMMGKSAIFDYSIHEIIRSTDFLVVDEILPTKPEEKPNEGERDSLHDLVRGRLSQGRPTLYVMELSLKVTSPKSFFSFYGKGLHRDLVDHNIQVECSVDSERQKLETKKRLELP